MNIVENQDLKYNNSVKNQKLRLFDSHCDTITATMKKNEELFQNSGHIDLKKMLDFDSLMQVFAIWINQKHYTDVKEQTLNTINFFYSQLDKNKNFISLVTNSDQIKYNKTKLRAILALEGGDAINSLEDVYTFYNLGVRLITLTWNNNNKIANGCSDDSGGVSKFGEDVICLMNNLHMIIDVSHLSHKSFWDVARLSKQPFIASHSNARAICNVKRNLTDRQILKIAECGGVIGINFYPPFVCESTHATSSDILRHIDYIINLTGDDFVGIGCDFDGIDSTPLDIKSLSDMYIIKDKLDSMYSPATVDKIMYKNFERVVSEIL